MRLKNKTNSVQEIHLLSGASIKVLKDGVIDVKETDVRIHELKRIKNFFEKIQVKEEKKVKVKNNIPKTSERILSKKLKTDESLNNNEIKED